MLMGLTLCFFSFRIKTIYNSINPHAKLCVSDVVKNLNVRAFNLMSRTNETRHTEWHETCKCKSRLDASVCNNKHRWNHDKYRCECKELIDKGVCKKGFIWNPSNCKCKCYKSCNFKEYLDYKNFTCKKRLVYKLVEECTENVEEVKLAKITLGADENKHKCRSCTLYIVLFSTIFTANIGISRYLLCFYWYLKRDIISVKFGTRTQTKI